MAVAKPNFIVKLSAKDYAAMLNATGPEGAVVAAGRLDPQIEFDDAAHLVRIGLDWRTFTTKHIHLRKPLKVLTAEEAMACATEDYKKAHAKRLEDAREGGRAAMQPPGFKEPPRPAVDPKARGTATAAGMLNGSPGIAVGRGHTDKASIDLLVDMLNQGGKPVDLFFIEELGAEVQDELNAYLSGSLDVEMGPALKKRVAEVKENYVDLEPVLAKAKEKGVKVYGIDSSQCDPGVENSDPSYGEKRTAVMNKFAADVVKGAVAANPGAKYMLMCGDAHLNTHDGGTPGLSQLLGIPAMHVTQDKKLRVAPDQKALRGVPGKAEQAFLDAAMAAANAQYKVIEGRNPKNLEGPPLRRALGKLAKNFVASKELSAPGDAQGLLNNAKTKAAIDAACEAAKGRGKRKPDMVEAIGKGDVAVLRKLLAEDPDIVVSRDEHDVTLLHAAAKSGNAAIIELLVAAGADPNALNDGGTTPMHEACSCAGDEKQVARGVKSMLDAGGDPAIPDANCKTPYDRATERRDPTLMLALHEEGHGKTQDVWVTKFEKRAQADYEDSGRDSKEHDDFDAGELRKLALSRFEKMSAVTRIADANDVDEVLNVDDVSEAAISELIKRTKGRKKRRLDMFAAIDGNDGAAARKIIEEDPAFATLNMSEGMTALDMAAVGHKNDAVISLIQGGADPKHVNARNRTPLLEVSTKEVEKDGTNKGKQDVHETAGILLDLGADANQVDRFGRTALHYAGQFNNAELVGTLAEKSADPNVKDDRGWTPLDMTQGSTCKEAEQAFFDNGLGSPKSTVPPGKHSTVDLLCMATKVNNAPEDELKVRKMYEKLYAMETMRPILDLAAAATCNDRGPPKGGLKVFVTDMLTTGNLLGKDSGGSAGAYDEKVNSLLLATKNDQAEGEASGTLAHELTHMTAHLVTDDERTFPFKPGDDAGKAEYMRAIEGDMKQLHLLGESDPAQKFVKSQASGRMAAKGYAKQKMGETDFSGVDERLMQEHVVGVPQLMATYGEDYVRGKAPNMTAYFEKLSKRAEETLKTDPRFAKGRAAMDVGKNKALAAQLEARGAGPKPPAKRTINKDSPEFDVDKMVENLRTGLTAQLGSPKRSPANKGPSVVHSQADFEVDDKTKKLIDKRLAVLKKILGTTMGQDRLPREISSEAMPELLRALGEAVSTSEDDKAFLKSATMLSDTWTKKANVDFVKDKAVAGRNVTAEELAKAVVFEAEMRARVGTGGDDALVAAALDAGQSKQKKAVAELTRELSKTENAEKMKKPGELLRVLPQALVNPGKDAIRVKTKPKRFGRKRDGQHVSIDLKSAKKTWVEALGTIAA